MSELPLFPLRAVLYPHMSLPLHVFELRYQRLLRDCLESGGRFGVVGIRSGDEVGGRAVPEEVGTEAVITDLRLLPGGRSHVLVTGARRFRIKELVPGMPYPRAEVDLLHEPDPDPAAFILASEARAALTRYTAGLARISGGAASSNALPTDPLLLSWVIASTLMIELPHRQQLLEVPGFSQRLRLEIQLLQREVTLLNLQLANRLQTVPTYGRN
ncbi:MAG: LON peptidase substrate-binding domain-containing protein [Candidatus Dormibacteria bacterium]